MKKFLFGISFALFANVAFASTEQEIEMQLQQVRDEMNQQVDALRNEVDNCKKIEENDCDTLENLLREVEIKMEMIN